MKYYKFINPDGSMGYYRGDNPDMIRNSPGITDFQDSNIEDFAIICGEKLGIDPNVCGDILVQEELAYKKKQEEIDKIINSKEKPRDDKTKDDKPKK